MAPAHHVLVIGVGSIGERHVRCFLATSRAAVAVVEINDELRSTVAGRYGVPQFPTLDAALREPPGAAVIATPAHTHVPIAQRLVALGIHVLIEKPLSTDLGEVGK